MKPTWTSLSGPQQRLLLTADDFGCLHPRSMRGGEWNVVQALVERGLAEYDKTAVLTDLGCEVLAQRPKEGDRG